MRSLTPTGGRVLEVCNRPIVLLMPTAQACFRGSADAAAIDATEREASDPSCAAGAPIMHAHADDAASSLDFDAAGAQLAAGFPEGEVRLFAVNALGEWGDFSSVAL